MLRRKGFSPVEVILAGSVLALMVTAVVGALVYGREGAEISGSRARAVFLAEEGLEAVRNLRDENFANLTNGSFGLATSGAQWIFSGAQDVTENFTRVIQIGTIDAKTKHVTSTVTWQPNPQRTNQVVLETRLTNWRISTQRGGVVVYGDGGTATDTIMYRILDPTAGTWGPVLAAADIDPATTNRSLRAVQVYASATRNEKVMISRHSNATNQFVYAQVFNGTNWGNVVLLGSWAAATFLDVQNFSGTYLQNGDFMVAYSDNTTIPKFRVWNGVSWIAQTSMQTVGGIPNYIVVKARPGTNEVMAAFFDQGSDTNTEYFNGGAYVTGSWTLHTEHSAVAPVNTKQLVDFAWSPNNTLRGGLVYSNSGTDLSLNIKIWTANGAGGGTWSGTVNTANQASRLGALEISGRVGADEFIACDKDANATPRVLCYRSNFTPAWTNPTNQIIAPSPPGTDTGIQKSYGMGFEAAGGSTALGVYSDVTTIPKLKKYTAATNTWDAAATNVNALGGALETVRLIAHPESDDIMILLADTNQDLYSVVWDGSVNALYTTPSGNAFSSHGVSGAADVNFWFDFAWDKF